jgi:hypothetical protein
MTSKTLTMPELVLIAGTRVALGVGIGLLIADRFTDNERKAAGWALISVGAMTTIPIVADLIGQHQITERR